MSGVEASAMRSKADVTCEGVVVKAWVHSCKCEVGGVCSNRALLLACEDLVSETKRCVVSQRRDRFI